MTGQNKLIKGIAAAPGIAIGRVFVKKEAETLIKKKAVADINGELDRLDHALTQAKQELTALKESTAEKMGEKNAEIFQAHLMFLSDPEFIAGIEQQISEDKINAEFAVQQMVEHYVRLFAQLTSAYMRGREADIKDVGARIISILQNKKKLASKPAPKGIICARNLTPSDTTQLDSTRVLGIISGEGSMTSHSSIIARSMGIPAVVGIGTDLIIDDLEGSNVIIDGNKGLVLLNPAQQLIKDYRQQLAELKEQQSRLKQFINKKAVTRDGERVEVAGNIGTAAEVELILNNGGEGIGLFRTEFLYMNREELPTEDEQFVVYSEVARKMGKQKVIIRTLDIGGDKQLAYLEQPEEMNPFLGYRAIRMSLDQPKIFKSQLKAILRTNQYGNIKLMYPMISSVQEIKEANRVLQACRTELEVEGKEFERNLEVGIMIETPAAAVIADALAQEVDFFSIGTNDLIQYTIAVDRSNEKIANLHQAYHPAVLRLIKRTIEQAHQQGIWVGMCGEASADQLLLPFLLGAGLDEFSMNAGSILKIKAELNKWTREEAKKITEQTLKLKNTAQIKEYLQKISKK